MAIPNIEQYDEQTGGNELIRQYKEYKSQLSKRVEKPEDLRTTPSNLSEILQRAAKASELATEPVFGESEKLSAQPLYTPSEEQIEYAQQSFWDRTKDVAGSLAGKAAIDLTVGLGEGVSYLLDFQQHANLAQGTENEFTNWYSEWLESLRQTDVLQVPRSDFGGDFGNWIADNVPSLLSTVTLMVPALAAGRAASMAAKGLRVAYLPESLSTIEGLTAATVSRYAENTMESGQTVKQLLDEARADAEGKGIVFDEAAATAEAGKAGRLVWYANNANLLLDFMQYSSILKGFGPTGKLIDFTKVPAGEAFEEFNQFVIQEEATRKGRIGLKIKEEDFSTPYDRIMGYLTDENALNAAFWGAAGGSLFQYVGNRIEQGRIKARANYDSRLAAERAKLLGNKELFNKIKDQEFAQVAINHATIGKTDRLIQELNELKRTGDEDAMKLGWDPDFKKNIDQRVEDAEFIADAYNRVQYGVDASQDVKLHMVDNMLSQRLEERYNNELRSSIDGVYGSTNIQPGLESAKRVDTILKAVKKLTPEIQARLAKSPNTALSNLLNELVLMDDQLSRDLDAAVQTYSETYRVPKTQIPAQLVSSADVSLVDLESKLILSNVNLRSLKTKGLLLSTKKGRKEFEQEISREAKIRRDAEIAVEKERADAEAKKVKETVETTPVQEFKRPEVPVPVVSKEPLKPGPKPAGTVQAEEAELGHEPEVVSHDEPDVSEISETEEQVTYNSRIFSIYLKEQQAKKAQAADVHDAEKEQQEDIKDSFETKATELIPAVYKDVIQSELKGQQEGDDPASIRAGGRTVFRNNRWLAINKMNYLSVKYSVEERAGVLVETDVIDEAGARVRNLSSGNPMENPAELLPGSEVELFVDTSLTDPEYGYETHKNNVDEVPIRFRYKGQPIDAYVPRISWIIENSKGVAQQKEMIDNLRTLRKLVFDNPNTVFTTKVTAKTNGFRLAYAEPKRLHVKQQLGDVKLVVGYRGTYRSSAAEEFTPGIKIPPYNGAVYAAIRTANGTLFPELLDIRFLDRADTETVYQLIKRVAAGESKKAPILPAEITTIEEAINLVVYEGYGTTRRDTLGNRNDASIFYIDEKNKRLEINGRYGEDSIPFSAILSDSSKAEILDYLSRRTRAVRLNLINTKEPYRHPAYREGKVWLDTYETGYNDFLYDAAVLSTDMQQGSNFVQPVILFDYNIKPAAVGVTKLIPATKTSGEASASQNPQDSDFLFGFNNYDAGEIDLTKLSPDAEAALKEIFQRAKRGEIEIKNLREELERIRKDKPVYSKTIDLLLTKVNENLELVFKPITDEGFDGKKIKVSSLATLGRAYYETGIIEIYDSVINLLAKARGNIESRDLIDDVLIHELIHGISSLKIKQYSINPELLTDSEIKAIKGLIGIYNETKERFKGTQYADANVFKDVHEFVADNRNPEYAEVFADRSAWHRMWDFILKLFYRDNLTLNQRYIHKYLSKLEKVSYEARNTFKPGRYKDKISDFKLPVITLDQQKEILDIINYNVVQFNKLRPEASVDEVYDDIKSRFQKNADKRDGEARLRLQYVIDNFEQIKKLSKKELRYINVFINSDDVFDNVEAEEDSETYSKQRFEINHKDSASTRIKQLIAFTPITSESSFLGAGIIKFVDPVKTYNKIQELLGDREAEEFLPVLYDNAGYFPELALIADRVNSDDNLWYDFHSNFYKQREDVVSVGFKRRGKRYNFNTFQSNSSGLAAELVREWYVSFKMKGGFDKTAAAYDAYKSWNRTDGLDKLASVLNELGIGVNQRTLEYIEANPKAIDGVSNSLGAFLTNNVNHIFDRLTGKVRRANESVELEEGEEVQIKDPFIHEQRSLKNLAKAHLAVVYPKHNGSFRREDGKIVYPFQEYNFISKFVRRISSDNAELRQPLIDKLLSVPFSKDSIALNRLNADSAYRLNFKLRSVSTLVEYGRGRQSTQALTPLEYYVLKLNMFFNGGKDSGMVFLLTPGDNQHIPAIQFIKEKVGYDEASGKLDELTGRKLFSLVKSEVLRIQQATDQLNTLPKEKLIRGYHYNEGGELGDAFKFHFFPFLNNDTNVIENGVLNPVISTEGRDQVAYITSVVEKYTVNKIRDEIGKLQSEELLTTDTDGKISSAKYIDTRAVNMAAGTSVHDKINNMMASYVVNYMLMNADVVRMMTGDIALYGGADKMSKRIKELIAPGAGLVSRGNDSRYYKRGVVSDVITSSRLYDQLKATIGGKADKYLKNNSTDSQMVLSVKGYMDILKRQGKLTDAIQKALADIEAGIDTDEALDIILQPLKPVYYSTDVVDGILRPEYDKFSGIPLLPSLTRGLEIDKLRKWMDKNDVSQVVYESAVKTGANNPQPIQSENSGNLIWENFDAVEIKELSYDGLLIQQEVPFKDSFPTESSQLRKIILADLTSDNVFTVHGNAVNGDELRLLYYQAHDEIIKRELSGLMVRVGVTKLPEETPDGRLFEYKDIQAVSRELLRYAEDRGLPINALEGLEPSGDLKDFNIPLYGTAYGSKYESVLNSVVKSRLVKLRRPGMIYKQVSGAGFHSKFTAEQVKQFSELAPDAKIQWVNENDTSLKYYEGPGSYVEVLVPDYFRVVADKIDPQLLVGIAYRIPLQEMSSMAPFKIKGFLPKEMGTVIVINGELVTQQGSDFDFDTLFTVRYHHEKDAGQYKKVEVITGTDEESVNNRFKQYEKYQLKRKEIRDYLKKLGVFEYSDYMRVLSTTHGLSDQLLNLFGVNDTETEVLEILREEGRILSKEQFSELPLISQLTREALDNYILDIEMAVLLSDYGFNKLVSPVDASDIETLAKRITLLKGVGILSESPLLPQSQEEYRQRNAASVNLRGHIVNQNTNHVLAQQSRWHLTKGTVLFKDSSGKLMADAGADGLYTLDKTVNKTDGNLISKEISSYVGAIIDITKHPEIGNTNINQFTSNILGLLLRLGVGYERANTFISIPIIEEYSRLSLSRRGAVIRHSTKVSPEDLLLQRMVSYVQGKEPTFTFQFKDDAGNYLNNPVPLSLREMEELIASDTIIRLPDDESRRNFAREAGFSATYDTFSANTEDFKAAYIKSSINALNAFLQYNERAQELGRAVLSTTIDTQNVSIGPYFAHNKKREQFISYVSAESAIGNYESAFENTILGSIADNGLFTGAKIFEQFFPYNTPAFRNIEEYFFAQYGSLSADNLQYIRSEAIAYTVSNASFLKVSPSELRKNLTDLAVELHTFKESNPEFYDSNAFLRRLQPLPDRQAVVLNNSVLKEYREADQMTLAFNDLFINSDPKVQTLAKRLVRYSILSSGLRNIKGSFGSLIPADLLKNIGYGEFLRLTKEIGMKDSGFMQAFPRQFYQNNSNKIIARVAPDFSNIINPAFTEDKVLINFAVNSSKSKDLKVARSASGTAQFPDFISHTNILGKSSIYEKQGETAGNTYYKIANKLGYSGVEGTLKEYEFGNDNLESVYPWNEIKVGAVKIISGAYKTGAASISTVPMSTQPVNEAQNRAGNVINFFQTKFNLPVQYDNTLSSNIGGYVKDNKVYLNPNINPDKLEEVLIEEYTHIITLKLEKEHPEIFEELFNNLINAPEYKEIRDKAIAKVNSLYPELSKREVEKLLNKQIENQNKINYSLKAIPIITRNLDKVKQWEKQVQNPPVFWEKLQKDLGIPKEQIELLKNSEGNTIEEKLLDFAANYSYTVEINTAVDKVRGREEIFEIAGWEYSYSTSTFGEGERNYYKESPRGKEEKITSEEYFNAYKKYQSQNIYPTGYYSGLTVPGGTNYTENEISTPLITPSIKGHAQFSTDQGIGWFRSDEQDIKVPIIILQQGKQAVEEYKNSKKGLGDKSSKTRRILEIQSDLFQKGRENPQLSQIDQTMKSKGISKEDAIKAAQPSNQFLQLLNKDNNWVTFFVKSTIQDSAKKGYEKVLFPSGNTASKVEGHTTLEEFKKQKEDRIKLLEKDNLAIKFDKEYLKYKREELFYTDIVNDKQIIKELQESNNNEITQLKQELERVEGPEGFGALKPIYNFYENTVKNILKKNYPVNQITDEYGNTWNEINLSQKDIDNIILLSKLAGEVDNSKTQLPSKITQSFKHEVLGQATAMATKGKVSNGLSKIANDILKWIKDVLNKIGFRNIDTIKTFKDLKQVFEENNHRINLNQSVRKELGGKEESSLINKISSVSDNEAQDRANKCK